MAPEEGKGEKEVTKCSWWHLISGSYSASPQWENRFLHPQPVVRNGTKLLAAIRGFCLFPVNTNSHRQELQLPVSKFRGLVEKQKKIRRLLWIVEQFHRSVQLAKSVRNSQLNFCQELIDPLPLSKAGSSFSSLPMGRCSNSYDCCHNSWHWSWRVEVCP